MLKLVHEVKTNVSEADRWYGEDLAALQAYVKSMGKANDMTPSYFTSNTTSMQPSAPSDSSLPLTLPSQTQAQADVQHVDNNIDSNEANTLVNSSQTTQMKLNEAHLTGDTNIPTDTNTVPVPAPVPVATDEDINSTNMSTLAKMLSEEIRLVIPGTRTSHYNVFY